MKRLDIRGTIIPNGYKWYYDLFGEESTCPKDVQDAMDAAGGDALEVYISSGGGVIESGSEIYTALKKYPGEVKMYITGVAHSAASVIAMARHCEMSGTTMTWRSRQRSCGRQTGRCARPTWRRRAWTRPGPWP